MDLRHGPPPRTPGRKRRPDRWGSIDHYGYVRVCLPGSHRQFHLHRLVVESVLGRRLGPREHIHHRDGNKRNNHPSNLEVTDPSGHHEFHRKLPRQTVAHCQQCQAWFLPRYRYYSKAGVHLVAVTRFCSRRCALLFRWRVIRYLRSHRLA